MGLGLLLSGVTSPSAAAEKRSGVQRPIKPFSYVNERDPTGPWSIHRITISLTNEQYELHTSLGSGTISGMSTLEDQVKSLPPELGRPIAAVNGDFYRDESEFSRGDPRGLQILQGELISGPRDHACFWVDQEGRPHLGMVISLFRVTWPDNSTTPFGLNEVRPSDGATLYTPIMGPSTGTGDGGGLEIILEAVEGQPWLPLLPGISFQARVREVRQTGGDTPLAKDSMVLSLGPRLARDTPEVGPGDLLKISTATVPNLANCKTGLGGGPRLLVDGGMVKGWRSPIQRHPRAGIGWNDDFIHILLVDGRQPGFSVGMSLRELAERFLELGCTHALNLDGGGSTSMWAFGQVVSRPSEGMERPIANGLVVIKKPKKSVP